MLRQDMSMGRINSRIKNALKTAGWTKLDGFSGIYYREVGAADTEKEFYVLKDNKVKYDAALENSDMMTNNVLKQGIALTLKVSAIQKEGFDNNAAAAYKCIGTTVISEPEDFAAALNAGEPVSITKDMNIDASTIQNAFNPEINLNGKNLLLILAIQAILFLIKMKK